MAQESVWKQISKPQFVEPDRNIQTLFGIPSSRAGSIAAGTAFAATLLVIPAVFMAASQHSTLKTLGYWLGYLIWAVFVAEVLVFVRLEVGWGSLWLKKHWLQVLVVFLASPLTAVVLEHAVMPLVSTLFNVQGFVSLGKAGAVLSKVKFIKILHLGEVRQRVLHAAWHVRWLYRTTMTSIAICILGILGAAASGGALTPIHGLEMWIELVQQSWAVAPELFLVSAPLVVLIGGFAMLQTRPPWRGRRRP
jgi:hypothetical protein